MRRRWEERRPSDCWRFRLELELQHRFRPEPCRQRRGLDSCFGWCCRLPHLNISTIHQRLAEMLSVVIIPVSPTLVSGDAVSYRISTLYTIRGRPRKY